MKQKGPAAMGITAGYMVPHPPIVIPEIGNGEEKKIQLTEESYDKIGKDIALQKPDTIILSSPHSIMYSDYFHISPGSHAAGDLRQFGAAGVSFDVDYDTEFTEVLSDICAGNDFPAGMKGEREPGLDHGTMIPLYFINRYYTDYRLVRISLSGLPIEEHFMFGKLINEAACITGKRAVFVASGDLSHCQKPDGPYRYKPDRPRYDAQIMDLMKRGALDELTEFDEVFLEKAQECGHRSFTIMAGVFSGSRTVPEVLSHESTFGVGYGFGIFRRG